MTDKTKIDFGDFILSEERKKELMNLPVVVAWRNLCAKIDDGIATPEEIAQYNYKLEPIEEAMRTPNFIAPDMSHDELDALLREKRRKRLAAEAEAADQTPE